MNVSFEISSFAQICLIGNPAGETVSQQRDKKSEAKQKQTKLIELRRETLKINRNKRKNNIAKRLKYFELTLSEKKSLVMMSLQSLHSLIKTG